MSDTLTSSLPRVRIVHMICDLRSDQRIKEYRSSRGCENESRSEGYGQDGAHLITFFFSRSSLETIFFRSIFRDHRRYADYVTEQRSRDHK